MSHGCSGLDYTTTVVNLPATGFAIRANSILLFELISCVHLFYFDIFQHYSSPWLSTCVQIHVAGMTELRGWLPIVS